MSCKSCQSKNTRTFDANIGIHFPGLAGLDKPLVLVSPKIKVCLECAVAEFAIPESELRRLKEGENAAA
ncbi:MAG: hypothetical protein DMG79_22530 [Acidobacteria bacterium]|nr:MAG: hypothetical protein DMG79_22530 [Acidobacteriota bacterium]